MYAPSAPTFLIYKNCCQGSKEGHGHLRERKLLRYTLEKNYQTLSFSSPEENNYIASVHVVLVVCCFLILQITNFGTNYASVKHRLTSLLK